MEGDEELFNKDGAGRAESVAKTYDSERDT